MMYNESQAYDRLLQVLADTEVDPLKWLSKVNGLVCVWRGKGRREGERERERERERETAKLSFHVEVSYDSLKI